MTLKHISGKGFNMRSTHNVVTNFLLNRNSAQENNEGLAFFNDFVRDYYKNDKNLDINSLLSYSDNLKKLIRLIKCMKIDAMPVLEAANCSGMFKTNPELINSRYQSSMVYYYYLLHAAVNCQSDEVVKYLIDKGANPEVLDSMNRRPIDDAIKDHSIRKIALLLIGSLKIKFPSGVSLLPIHIVHELIGLSFPDKSKNMRIKVCGELLSPSFPYKFDFDWDTLRSILYRELLAIQHDEIFCSRKIGQGTYSNVYMGKLDSFKVAIKLCVNDTGNEERICRREADIHCYLQHPNIVKYICKMERYDVFGIVTEYCNYKTLTHCIESNNLSAIRNCLPSFLLQMNAGLKYLHDLGYVHLDFKSDNIFLHQENANTNERRVQIGDFGTMEKEWSIRPYDVTTYLFSSPERFDPSQPYRFQNDIYSLGVILGYMETGEAPWACIEDRAYIVDQVVNYENRFYKSCHMRLEVYELMMWSCEPELEKRPDCKQIENYIKNEF